jgi:transcription initiation factor TFIID subunit 13
VRQFLYAFGDDYQPLPETIRVLDEIITDFVIETCHQAARSASYSNRQKIKVDDFKFSVRNNEAMLGRVQELLTMDKELKEARKQIADDMNEGRAHVERNRPPGKEGAGKRAKKAKKREVTESEED